MKTLFIIGNGFDINLGMNTRYNDFYNYYQSIQTGSNLIKKLKEKISSDFKSWSDLELALGSYTKNLNSLDEFDEVFEDIGEQLAEYLQLEENNFDFEKIDKTRILNYLTVPEDSLLKADKDLLNIFKEKWHNYHWHVDIITLNYTRSLEKLLGETKNIEIGKHHKSISITLNGIEHIHGYVDDRMIMGVNDISQIENTEFHTNRDILESIIKVDCNKTHKHTIDDLCFNQISSANLICIFGSSIGDSDKYLWELIGQRLKNDCQLIIFTKGEEIKQRIGHKKGRVERAIKNLFLEKTKLSIEEKNKVFDRIFIGINTNMFSLLLK